MISSIAAGYLKKIFKAPCPFKFELMVFSVLINFTVAFLDNVARADKFCCTVALNILYSDLLAQQDTTTVIALVAL
jgi:hypothetical protein